MATRKLVVGEELTASEILELVRADAMRWATEEGVGKPMSAVVRVMTFGFEVDVEAGARAALCTYLSDGSRSMYQLTKGWR